MKKLIIPILCLLGLSSALARLGETKEQCEARYGRVVRIKDDFRPDFPQYCYAKNDVEIRVRFWQDKAGQVIISSDHGLPPATFNEIFQANAQGSTWQLDQAESAKKRDPQTYSDVRIYRRADGKATATYYRMALLGSDILTIETAEFNKTFNAKATGF